MVGWGKGQTGFFLRSLHLPIHLVAPVIIPYLPCAFSFLLCFTNYLCAVHIGVYIVYLNVMIITARLCILASVTEDIKCSKE